MKLRPQAGPAREAAAGGTDEGATDAGVTDGGVIDVTDSFVIVSWTKLQEMSCFR